jgi:hypothetical protein
MRLNSTAFPVLTSCGDWLPPAPKLAVAPQSPGARKQQRPRTDMLKKVVLNHVLLPFHAGTVSAASGEAAPEEAESLLTSTSSLCGRAADMLAGLVDVVERQAMHRLRTPGLEAHPVRDSAIVQPVALACVPAASAPLFSSSSSPARIAQREERVRWCATARVSEVPGRRRGA